MRARGTPAEEEDGDLEAILRFWRYLIKGRQSRVIVDCFIGQKYNPW